MTARRRKPTYEQLELPAELMQLWTEAPIKICWDWQRKFLMPDEADAEAQKDAPQEEAH